MSSSRPRTHQPGFGKRVACAVAGSVLVVVGIVLLVLPGPGLLLVLAGLLVLSHGFPAVERFVDPVQERAMKAAEESVSSPLRIVFSVGTGLVLIAAGVVWGLRPTLPLGGWATGASLILSGIILLALLVVSYRRVKQGRREQVS
jgi:Putative transmembrane protein (PGPGW)